VVAGPGRQRRYSDADRSAALAALGANGGNVNLTAGQLGIPETTLRGWANGDCHPQVARDAARQKPSLAARMRAIAHKMVGVADAKADALNAKDAMIAAGIATEKMLLLRGGRPAGGVTVVVVVQGANVGDL
jgi:transposase-like protein